MLGPSTTPIVSQPRRRIPSPRQRAISSRLPDAAGRAIVNESHRILDQSPHPRSLNHLHQKRGYHVSHHTTPQCNARSPDALPKAARIRRIQNTRSRKRSPVSHLLVNIDSAHAPLRRADDANHCFSDDNNSARSHACLLYQPPTLISLAARFLARIPLPDLARRHTGANADHHASSAMFDHAANQGRQHARKSPNAAVNTMFRKPTTLTPSDPSHHSVP